MSTARADVLVVAATHRELAPADGWRVLCCGVGPIDAAAATTRAIAADAPRLIIHVGIAGARRSAQLSLGSLVIGSSAVYADASASSAWVSREVTPAADLIAAARRALPSAHCLPIGTSARVGGTADSPVEAMEGFGVLRAAELAGVPALEVRVISNVIEELDRSLWAFDEAFAGVLSATSLLVEALSTRA
jgi:futalosine hydrolase